MKESSVKPAQVKSVLGSATRGAHYYSVSIAGWDTHTRIDTVTRRQNTYAHMKTGEPTSLELPFSV